MNLEGLPTRMRKGVMDQMEQTLSKLPNLKAMNSTVIRLKKYDS